MADWVGGREETFLPGPLHPPPRHLLVLLVSQVSKLEKIFPDRSRCLSRVRRSINTTDQMILLEMLSGELERTEISPPLNIVLLKVGHQAEVEEIFQFVFVLSHVNLGLAGGTPPPCSPPQSESAFYLDGAVISCNPRI